jgi:hypothetical protein
LNQKGLFIADGPSPNRKFTLEVRSALVSPCTDLDRTAVPKIYSSSCNPFLGMKVLRSTDLGKTFKETKSAPAFSKDDGRALANIWALEPGPEKQEVWAGVEPASLFRSGDGGDTWEMVDGISNHACAVVTGNGGLCCIRSCATASGASASRPAATI